jgi:hypothetical protein
MRVCTICLILLLLLTACSPATAGSPSPVVPAQTTQLPNSTSSPLPSLTPSQQATVTPNLTQALEEHKHQASLLLAENMDIAIKASASNWYVQIQELGGEVLYSHLAETPIYMDKLIHLPIAMLYLKAIESNNVTEIKKYLAAHGDYTTTLRQTLYEMTVYGSQVAANSIISTIPDYNLDITETLKSWHSADTNLKAVFSSVGSMTFLMGGLYSRALLSEESTVLILDMLDQGVVVDNPLRDLAPSGVKIHDKRVVITGEGSMVGEVAVIDTGQIAYVVTIIGLGKDPSPERYADLLQTYEKIVQIFWGFTHVR